MSLTPLSRNLSQLPLRNQVYLFIVVRVNVGSTMSYLASSKLQNEHPRSDLVHSRVPKHCEPYLAAVTLSPDSM